MKKSLKKDFIILFACLFFLFSFGRCATPEIQKLDTVYRHDMKIMIDGILYVGTGVVPNAEKYEIKVMPEGKADRIIWQTCHREGVIDKPSSGWFDSSYKFTLKPTKGIENVSPCALELSVLHEKKTKNGFALLDFQDAREEVSLPATLRCNGEVVNAKLGVGICQSAAGLIQEIEFSSPTVIAGVAGACDVMQTKDNLKFTYEMPEGKCTFNFVSKEKSKNGKRFVHRLNTIGYTEIPIR